MAYGGGQDDSGGEIGDETDKRARNDINDGDCPSNQYLFRMDPEHEAAITIMQGYIKSNFHACVVYSKQFEPYCRLVTAAKVWRRQSTYSNEICLSNFRHQ